MAILNTIRGKSSVLIIVIGMALFSFVFAELIKSGDSFGTEQTVVANVNGIDIERDDFMNKVESTERQNAGARSNIQSMNLVWDTELRRVVLKNQFNKVGISVERDQMRFILKNNLASFDEFLKKEHHNTVYIAHCEKGEKNHLKTIVNPKESATILIGPEGDFSSIEISKSIKSGYIPITLGDARLRTETAALVAVQNISFINQ